MNRVLSMKRKPAQTRSRKFHRLVKTVPSRRNFIFLEKNFWSSKSKKKANGMYPLFDQTTATNYY